MGLMVVVAIVATVATADDDDDLCAGINNIEANSNRCTCVSSQPAWCNYAAHYFL